MSAARHLRIAPSAEEVLRRDITEVCIQIDRRLHNRHGTAERGLYFWLYPPDDAIGAEVLTVLHRDAVAFLHALLTSDDPR